jgi:hypothetical protein
MRTLVIVSLVFCAACRGETRTAAAAGRAAPSGLPPLEGSAAADRAAPALVAPGPAPDGVTLAGAIVERIDAAPYTYLRIATAAGEEWAAVNQTDAKVGDKVSVSGAVMEGFQSKTLQRKFDRIVFGTLAAPSAPTALAEPAEPGAAHTAAAAGSGAKVPVAEGPGATTIAALYQNRASLAGKEVAVRGKVVKVNSGIMGKTWLHLQDGSGSAASADHDLTATTTSPVKLDEVVTVRGALRLDRDFGSGYRYAAIVEDATVQR